MLQLEKRITEKIIYKPPPAIDLGTLKTEIMDECKQMLKMELKALGLDKPKQFSEERLAMNKELVPARINSEIICPVKLEFEEEKVDTHPLSKEWFRLKPESELQSNTAPTPKTRASDTDALKKFMQPQ